MKAALALVALLSGIGASPALSQERSIFDDVKLEAIPETNGVKPYPKEMVLVRIRGVYRPKIMIQKLLQPELANFSWMHLSQDRNFETEFGGFPATGYERIIAVFPQRSGALEISSFTHRLKVVDGADGRNIDVKSPPVTLDVAKWEGPGGPDDPNAWWLPARDVKVTDNWASDPNRVVRGETVRRTVTIEALGVTAEQLPPPPVMRSPGIISFRGPTDRETKVTENGPIARAVYRWEMRPTTAFPAIVEPIKFPWFDTISRTMREAAIPAQRMAWAVEGAPPSSAGPRPVGRPPLAAALAAAGAAFLLGLALLLFGRRAGVLPEPPPAALRRMRLSAWRGAAAGFRGAVADLIRREPERSASWRDRAEIRSALAELDRSLYGADAAATRPNLRRLARMIAAGRREARQGSRARGSALAPLDGPRGSAARPR